MESSRVTPRKLRVQAPYWYRFDLGDAEITVVSDGWQMLGDPSNSFLGVSKEEVRRQSPDAALH